MKQINIKLVARCEAAGRENNEDNYQVIADVASDRLGFKIDEEISLGEKGSVLIACDGMGGMNAGEVASDIAVRVLKECFTAERVTKDVLVDPASYIVKAIQTADAEIKADGKKDPEHKGMGSTVVLVWLLNGKAYVGWCGDSRAYRYNKATGLKRLSHDHSYVQELVDSGQITEEDAFYHPNNNIITRSLGDPRGAAQPDTAIYDIQQGDIYLLCSDGLCGTLQDAEMQQIIEQHESSLVECRDALWLADEQAGWHDNVTIVMAQVLSGGAVASVKLTSANSLETVSDSKAFLLKKIQHLKFIIIGLVFLFLLLGVGYYYRNTIGDFFKTEENSINIQEEKQQSKAEEFSDSTSEQIESTKSKESESAKTETKKQENKQTVLGEQLDGVKEKTPVVDVKTKENIDQKEPEINPSSVKTSSDGTIKQVEVPKNTDTTKTETI